MNELRIIARRPVTFLARSLAGLAFSVLPLLEVMRKAPADINTFDWLILIATGLGNTANTIAAWFSTSATSARKELNGEDAIAADAKKS